MLDNDLDNGYGLYLDISRREVFSKDLSCPTYKVLVNEGKIKNLADSETPSIYMAYIFAHSEDGLLKNIELTLKTFFSFFNSKDYPYGLQEIIMTDPVRGFGLIWYGGAPSTRSLLMSIVDSMNLKLLNI